MLLNVIIFPTMVAIMTTIDNTQPKIDTLGNIVNAHDGNIIKSEDGSNTYYWYGTSYTLCNMNQSTACKFTRNTSAVHIPNAPSCGWTNNDFSVYESKDLNNWKLLNPSIIPSHVRPNGIYFRPKVLFNKKTNKYVLWFNYVTEGLPDSECPASWGPEGACQTVLGTAISDTAIGPFVIQQLPVKMGAVGSWKHGDFGTFIDDDGKAYIAYNAYDHGFDVSIDLLSDDYTNSTLQNSGYFTSRTEAPVILKISNDYFVITGPLCCFCEQGSTMAVYRSSSLLGTFNKTSIELNPSGSLHTQQSFALKLNESTYLWGGDRWQTAPYKSHDFVVWLPLQIKNGAPFPLSNISSNSNMKSLVLFTITLGFVCCVNSDTTTTMCDDKTPLTGITKQQSNEMTDQVNVLLAGPGLIGGALLQQIGAAKAKGVVVIGVANSKSFVVNKDGLDASKAKELLTSSSTSGTVIDFINAGAKLGLKNTVFVDCTASDSVSPAYAHALSLNLHIATANKKVNSDDLDYRKKVLELASQTAGPRFRYETNVGAGLPIIRPLLDAVESGDSVLEIEAILSGTLSYLFNTLSADIPFSQVVSKAKEMGFTEPDPRDDLSGSDVARKIVILARDAGFDVSLSDVKIEGFLPESCVAAKSVPEFLELLKTDCDQLIETRRLEASKNNQCLRYIASLNTTSGSPVMTLALKNIDLSHPAAGIAGSDNICVYRTKRYDSNPMVIKGPGAGAEVTAAGVFGDILSLRDLNVFPKSA